MQVDDVVRVTVGANRGQRGQIIRIEGPWFAVRIAGQTLHYKAGELEVVG